MYKQSKRRLLKWFDDNDDYNKDYTNSKWLKNSDFQRDFELELIWQLYLVILCHGIGHIDKKKKKGSSFLEIQKYFLLAQAVSINYNLFLLVFRQ